MAVGDFHKDEFNAEELEALGGAEEGEATEDKGPETQEAAETPAEETKPEEKGEEQKAPETEQKPAEEAKTEEGTVEEEQKDPVQKRIDKLTWEKNEERRKRDLALELGPERFYELYPEERPEGWKPPEKAEPKPRTEQPAAARPQAASTADLISQWGNRQLQDGPYKGYSLNDVIKEDPVYGLAVVEKEKARLEAEQARARDEQVRAGIEQEVRQFNANRAYEMFGKSVRECTAGELAKLKEAESAAIEFIEKNGNPNLALEHAYWRSIHEARRRANEAAEKKLDKVTDSKTVKSISGAAVPGADVEWQGYMSKTDAQMAAAIDKMTTSEYATLLKDAPKSVRDKFPDLPWR